MIKGVERISRIIMFVSIALFFGLLSFSVFLTKPLISNYVNEQIAKNQEDHSILEEKQKWSIQFDSDVDADQYYPIVVLRDGYKVLKVTGETAQIGWAYEVVNTTSDSRSINVTYKILDSDNFVIATGESSDTVGGKKVGKIRGTINIPVEDLARINNRTWSVVPGTYNRQYMVDNGFNRYKEAAKIIADKPIALLNYRWILNRCKLLFLAQEEPLIEPKISDKGEILESESEGIFPAPLKWRYCALSFEIKANEDLISAFRKLDVDNFVARHFPSSYLTFTGLCVVIRKRKESYY